MTSRPTSKIQAIFIGTGLAFAGAWSDPALATTTPVVTSFPLPSGSSRPNNIALGADGALWFTDNGTNSIGRIDPALATNGTSNGITEFPIPTGNSLADAITAGPDGALWFTEQSGNNIGRIDPTTHVIAEFPILTANSNPLGIASGPDGALWFVEETANNIGRIDPTTHTVTEFPITTSSSFPVGIAAGPDGALWFTETSNGGKIGRIDPTTKTITEFLTPSGDPQSIAAGPDGALWFLEFVPNKVGRIDPTKAVAGTSTGVTEFPVITANALLRGIAAGPDGALWFTEGITAGSSKIGQIVPAQATNGTSNGITEFSLSGAAGPIGIAAGPDQAMWFTENNAVPKKIGRITVPANALTVSGTGTGTGTITSVPSGIACGATCTANFGVGSQVTLAAAAAAGSIFTGWSGGGCSGVELCTVTLSADTDVSAAFVAETASDITLFSAILPASRSVAIGGTATVFGTIINSSADTTATNCTVQPATNIPAGFLFQTTDPKTNALTGPADTPVAIAPGAAQSFVLALTPSATIVPTDVAFTFACSNANAAAIFTGLNTLLLSAALPPPPDIVALAATANNDGIVDIPGATGTGAFAVATVNVGTSGAITASADTAAANLPVTISLCETNPGTGQCLAAPGASVATVINANATPTFAIFVQGSGAVTFSPASNRVFVRFKDASNTVRGETSVAVRTQ